MLLRTIACLAVLCTGACSNAADSPPTDTQLFKKLSAVAEQGSAKAQYNLGMLYNNGIGTARDPKRAFELFQRAAAAGDPLASYKVGCYYAGQFSGVVEIDHEKALAAKLVAAKAGYFRAQSDVGIFYAQMKNFHEAANWWSAAAAQGDLGSTVSLSEFYRSGLGVTKNTQKALELLLIAGRRVKDDRLAAVRSEIDALKKEVDVDGIARAETAAATWAPRPTALSTRAKLGIEEAQHLVQ